MQTHKNNNGFTDRLAACVERVGGKRAMATHALISEAQLFRYLNAESDVPSDRLVAIAKAADVDAGWLLTGNGSLEGIRIDLGPSFRPELMVQVVQTFEELLIESDKSFTPRQRATAMTFLYEAMRLEETRNGSEMHLDKKLAPFFPDFLAPLRSDNRMEQFRMAMTALEMDHEMSFQTLQQFDTLVKLTMLSVFDSAAGELFFEKMGTTLLPEAIKNITSTVNECLAMVGKKDADWLDAGCGNGRHLAFLSQHFSNLRIRGFDGSKQALHLCNQLVKAGKLPLGVVEEADFRNLPYEAESFDIVYCRLGLHLMPYVKGHAVGAVKYLEEVKRVLRPGGVATMLTYNGKGRDYITFTQYHTPETLRDLAQEAGLKIESIEECGVSETGGRAGQDYSNKFDMGLRVVFRK